MYSFISNSLMVVGGIMSSINDTVSTRSRGQDLHPLAIAVPQQLQHGTDGAHVMDYPFQATGDDGQTTVSGRALCSLCRYHTLVDHRDAFFSPSHTASGLHTYIVILISRRSVKAARQKPITALPAMEMYYLPTLASPRLSSRLRHLLCHLPRSLSPQSADPPKPLQLYQR